MVFCLRGNIHEHGRAAPVFRHQAAVSELLLYAIGQRVRLINFVDRNNDRNFRSMGVVDGFERLRHHAVIRRDDENDNVGGFRAARTHAGKGFVTGRIEEHDLAPVGRRIFIHECDFVGADMLGDSAGFAFGNVGGTDGIEQRRFAVVDVAHDGDNRRTRNRFGRAFFARGCASAISFAACSSKVMTFVSAPKKRAISLASSASSVWLMVAKTPRSSSRAIRSLARISSFSARSFTLMPSVIVIFRVIGSGSFESDMRGGGV